MTKDIQLRRDIVEELEWEPSVRSEHIGVVVENGVVTLTGFVATYPEKLAAEKAVRRVAGVRGLAEEIEVRLAGAPETSDAQIASRILSMLSYDITVPENHVQVQVEKGWVKLTGKVDWNYQREAVAYITGHMLGVLGVENLIEVRPLPTSADVQDRILAAFKRSADIDASAISVTTEGSTVHLSGKVLSWMDKRRAENAAWAAPGVSKVEDKLVIV